MVKITKNGKVMEVAFSAFGAYYENAGWKIVGSDNRKKTEVHPAPAAGEADEWDTALSEESDRKSLKDMSHNELMIEAEKHGIDISGNPSSKVLRSQLARYF